ncbi:MAG: MarC family NAAT transporter [Balneolaceae bacterium]|nr:MarC family NAAT transporter [Balneolaceae bacterium]
MIDFFQESVPFSSYMVGAGTYLIAAFTSIISVANPLGAMPVFISLTDQNSDKERVVIAQKAAFFMFVILTIFFLGGTYIMSFFGISLPGIRIAGGLIIMRAAYAMLTPGHGDRKLSQKDKEAAKSKEDVSFSPMAMPMLSGPGSIAVVIGLASQAEGMMDLAIVVVAIILCALIAYLILRLAPISAKYIGPTGMSAVTRMMGFIAMCIAVQFILNGISSFFSVG